jgi:predicted enzyme related to lactoylglutathione lyase
MNGVCHLEIPAKDFEKVKKFYGAMFNWEFTEMKDWNYLLFKAPDGVGGGFDKSYDISAKPGIVFYIEVDDIDSSLKKAESLGGKCIKPKTQISPEFGYLAFVSDLDGNHIGLWCKQ